MGLSSRGFAMPRTKNIRWTIPILVAMSFSVPAVAGGKPFSQAGTGLFSCGKFIEYDRQPNNTVQMQVIVQWAWGFMSAYNARSVFSPTFHGELAAKQIELPDEPTVLLFIRRHCEKSPLTTVANATLDLIASLGGFVAGHTGSSAP
jgi:hypothetical protein